MKWFTEAKRAYTYRVLAALGGAAAFYGWMSVDEVVMWVGITAVALMISPVANTPTKRVEEYPADARVTERSNGYDHPAL